MRRIFTPHRGGNGDNGVHASASPFEGIAERMNWLGQALDTDPFGSALLANGLSAAPWSVNRHGRVDFLYDFIFLSKSGTPETLLYFMTGRTSLRDPNKIT